MPPSIKQFKTAHKIKPDQNLLQVILNLESLTLNLKKELKSTKPLLKFPPGFQKLSRIESDIQTTKRTFIY